MVKQTLSVHSGRRKGISYLMANSTLKEAKASDENNLQFNRRKVTSGFIAVITGNRHYCQITALMEMVKTPLHH
uniref:Transposase n=1 Tax=Panagrellus redivivus TaxID=6233 RepID=A0A7E4VLA4_PANRE